MTSNNHIEYSVVIPVYNSAEFLQELYDRLQSVFKQMNKTFEVIFVNDCSRDNSLNILQEIHSQYNNIIVADLYTNFGQQNALMCGFQYCEGQYIITMDDDLQNPPEEIPVLIEKLKICHKKGVKNIFGNFGFPGMDKEKSLRSIELFCTQVLPEIRKFEESESKSNV